MRIPFNRFNRRVDIAKEWISELEFVSIEIVQTKIQSEKSGKKLNRAPKSCGIMSKVLKYVLLES